MKIIGKETLHSGRKFDFAIHITESADGKTLRQEFIDHPGAVVLIPLLAPQTVVLLRNYRHSIDQVLWELPAGTVNRGEPVRTTASRELMEETGYAAGKLTHLLEFYIAPGATSERMHLFLAEDLVAGETAREPDEEMEVHLVELPVALQMIDRGEIQDAKTILGLWHFARQRSVEGSQCTTE